MHHRLNCAGQLILPLAIAGALVLGLPFVGWTQTPAGSSARPATKATDKTADESLDDVIAALKSGDTSFGNLYNRLHKLKKLPVDAKRREEVAELLDPLLTLDNPSVRRQAQDAIVGWGTKTNEATLLELLEWQDRGDRHAAMEALAALGGSKESAEAIAKQLLDSDHRSYAVRALAKMGAYAEEAVWPHIGSADVHIHSSACQVLGYVGGPKSLVKLKARKERDSTSRSAVQNAVRDMEKRLRKR